MERIPALILSSAIAAASTLSWQSPARAQDESSLALEIFEAGSAYYKQGSYDKALEQFEEAYRLDPLPELLYNIAQCHERLQQLPAAIDAYQRYLEQDPGAEDRQAVEQKIEKLQAKLEKTGIVLEVSEPGAQVLIDGEQAGTSPVEELIRTQPGSHQLEIIKKGFQPSRMKFTVLPGISQEIQVTLVPLPPEDQDEAPPTWFYWTYGITAAAGAAAVVTGVLALDKAGDASATGSPTRYDADRSAALRLAITTDVLIGVAAIGAIVSTAGIIAASKKKKGEARVGLTPLVSPTCAGLSLQLTF
jgi:tetratricopeptide (TPR) repeat protein